MFTYIISSGLVFIFFILFNVKDFFTYLGKIEDVMELTPPEDISYLSPQQLLQAREVYYSKNTGYMLQATI